VIVYVCLLAVLTAFYTATSQREVSWQDSGMFQHRILHRDYAGDLGLALAHPMYILMQQAVVRVTPTDHLLWAINAFSGLGLAIALANLSLLIHRLTGRWWAGVGMAAILAVAHTNWWLGTIAEVYTWSIAGLSLECLLLVSLIRRPRWATLAGLALVSGWGLSVHNFALLPLPVHLTVAVYLMVRRKLPVWSALPAVAAYGIGGAMYFVMVASCASGAGWPAAIGSALFGDHYMDQVLGGGAWQFLRYNLALMALNGISVLPILAAVGWWHARRRLGGETALALATIAFIQTVFVLRYPVPDQFTFCLPALWMGGLAGGVGLAVLAERSRRWRSAVIVGVLLSIVAGPMVYALLPRAIDVPASRRTLPFRDEIRYWITPWKHNEHSAGLFAEAALRQLDSVDGEPIVILDSTPIFPVLITQEMERDGCGCLEPQIQHNGSPLPLKQDAAAVRRAAGLRPIYVLPHAIPRALRNDTTAVKDHQDDVLYRLQWNEATSDL